MGYALDTLVIDGDRKARQKFNQQVRIQRARKGLCIVCGCEQARYNFTPVATHQPGEKLMGGECASCVD